MIYVQTNNQSNIQGVEFDTAAGKISGKPFWITQGDREITRAELSPDGTRFAMRIIRRTQDDLDTIARNVDTWAHAGFGYLVCGWPAGGRDQVEAFATRFLAT